MRRIAPFRVRRQRGSSLLETALLIVVVFTVVFWVFEMCWLMYTYSVLADAANEGVRYAIVHAGADSSGTTARVKTVAGASMHDVTAITVTVTAPDLDYVPPHRVRVTVSYTYVPYLGQFISAPTMHADAEGAMVVK